MAKDLVEQVAGHKRLGTELLTKTLNEIAAHETSLRRLYRVRIELDPSNPESKESVTIEALPPGARMPSPTNTRTRAPRAASKPAPKAAPKAARQAAPRTPTAAKGGKRTDWGAILERLPVQFRPSDVKALVPEKPGGETSACLVRWQKAGLVERIDRSLYNKIAQGANGSDMHAGRHKGRDESAEQMGAQE